MMKIKPSFLLWSVLVGALPVFANPEPDSELRDVRQAIELTQQNLRTKETAQKQTQAKLEQTRILLAKIQRELEELNRQQQEAWEKLQDLQIRITQLQTEVAGTKAQVSRLLIANYKNRRPNAVVLFLKHADPNQKSRFLNYTRYINESNDRVLKLLMQQQAELSQQEHAINRELDRLRTLTLRQQKKMRELGQNRSKAQNVSRQLNADIDRQRNQLSKLREDEQRLNNVVANISAPQNNPPDTITEQTNNIDTQHQFSKQQGRLPMPAQGEVKGTFGSKRDSGGTWRGLFIATAPASVKAISAGRVAYVENLKGYGNTVIIDHGSGYSTIYTGMSKFAVNKGDAVRQGQIIGNSGTLPAGEEGLYFELRYQGKIMNPRSWVAK